ncbi:hypothetical protein KR093_010722 [Drosophila rubida]|uniref:Single domain-containing protein n=1 Tax=Drosophila rubida TaxID=30044 RepID=A0AAD4PRL3_9MUSC|nr:hypothetical protein KR093_010722 [Drosophila rubida]
MRRCHLDNLLRLALVLMLTSQVPGFALQYRGNTQHPILPDHCYYEELDLAVPLKDTVNPVNVGNSCVSVFCREDYVLMVQHCDRINFGSGCIITANDYTRPYPDCCPKIICPR